MIGSTIRALVSVAIGIALAGAPAQAGGVGPPVGAIAMHGDPVMTAEFDHLPYVNPAAPKGGRLNLAYLGAFDSLNPYNVKALSTAQGLIGNVYQSLMARSADEPFTLYGLIANSIETNAARDKVVFHLDPAARFSDRAPITSADVVFTFNLLRGAFRGPDAADPGRLRPLPGDRSQAGRAAGARARSELLGERSADLQRPVQLR
jgi:peptide/nickel transport system substrate-binding protein